MKRRRIYYSAEQRAEIARQLNQRTRKTLLFQTPSEVCRVCCDHPLNPPRNAADALNRLYLPKKSHLSGLIKVQNYVRASQQQCEPVAPHSTVTLFARLRG
jgi:hypothetical protein